MKIIGVCVLTHDAEKRRLVEQACVDYERDLRAFLNGILRDSHFAEDTFQRTVVRAIESSSAANSATIRGWLFRIALNTARDLKRKLARENQRLRAVQELSAAPVVNHMYNDVANLVTEEERDLVRQALNQLNKNYRQVVIRRIQNGQSFAEIAEELDRPLGTILTWMRRALIELREMNIIRSLSDDGTPG